MSGGIFWLASYPKSGNTWMRAFIANLLHEKEEAADINELHVGGIASGRGWLDEELGFDTGELSHDEIDRLRPAVYRRCHQDLTEFCYCKCHDAWTLLPDGSPLFPPDATCGALYLLRNPLDVAVSYAHHCTVDLDKAIAIMGDSKAVFCAADHRLANQVRQKLLDWSGHVRSWTEAPGLNVLIYLHFTGHTNYPNGNRRCVYGQSKMPIQISSVKPFAWLLKTAWVFARLNGASASPLES